ncbi:MAG: class E sortase, partial [Acidimicrobiales bacterium]|nr:class E sortase [Acidimicrobiales bacterium]
VPEALPDDTYADSPETVVGRIAIPTIGLDEALQQGMTLTAINRGPSHWPGTAGPGELGNVVVAGHRTTYSRPFHDLDLLRVGDPVVSTTDRGTFTYAVTGTEIVTPEEVRIADQTAAYTSTLFACHPPGSAAYRIVVHLQLLDAAGRPVPPFEAPVAPVTIPRPA